MCVGGIEKKSDSKLEPYIRAEGREEAKGGIKGEPKIIEEDKESAVRERMREMQDVKQEDK